MYVQLKSYILTKESYRLAKKKGTHTNLKKPYNTEYQNTQPKVCGIVEFNLRNDIGSFATIHPV